MDLFCEQFLSIGINPNRHRTLGATLGALASLIFVLLAASSASALTRNVVGGQLLGASDVIVDGSLYDVEFFDGSCNTLLAACYISPFATSATALLAAQALLDQVFLDIGGDLFDSDSNLTEGCDVGIPICRAVTPYGFPAGGFVELSVAENRGLGLGPDNTFLISLPLTGGSQDISFAIWTAVPEPSTALLLGVGLAALGARRRASGTA